jgi:hypothetical protein
VLSPFVVAGEKKGVMRLIDSHAGRAFRLAAAYLILFSLVAAGEQRPGDLQALLDQLAAHKGSSTLRAREAEHLCEICVTQLRRGNKTSVLNQLDRLIELLDDQNKAVVFWAALSIGALGKDGSKALPKLEALASESEERSELSVQSGIKFAIRKIKESAEN